MARGRGVSCVSHAIPLVLIVVAVETEQLPVAPIRRIVVVVMVLVMDRELVEFLAVKFAAELTSIPVMEQLMKVLLYRLEDCPNNLFPRWIPVLQFSMRFPYALTLVESSTMIPHPL